MKIALGSDHGGYVMKEHVKEWLLNHGYEVEDKGCFGLESVDYPIYAKAAAEAVASGECDRGIVVCTTGIGISISCNKIKGIRCALCGDAYSAEMTRRHNNANMLALGGGFVGPFLADHIVEVFLNTEFEGGRHQRRIDLVHELES